MLREEAKRAIYKAAKEDTSSPKDCIHLLNLHRFIDQIYDEHEAELKAKDDEIASLKSDKEQLINDVIVKDNDLERLVAMSQKTAHKIVAMLFWESRKTLTEYRSQEHCDALYNFYYGQKLQFVDAYRMLKEK